MSYFCCIYAISFVQPIGVGSACIPLYVIQLHLPLFKNGARLTNNGNGLNLISLYFSTDDLAKVGDEEVVAEDQLGLRGHGRGFLLVF